MKSIIYSRVSTKDQNTDRQINDLKSINGFEVVKTFREKASGFSKSIEDRAVIQEAISFMIDHQIECIMVSEISRLGRNTLEVLSFIDELKKKGLKVYIHNLGTIVNNNDPKGEIFSKLVITIMADLARLESEQMSLRIKSGIRNRKVKGLTTGRREGSIESKEKFLNKHRDIQKYLSKGYSSREIQKICKCSPNTVLKVKKHIALL